jgi:hypothetical protein
MTRIERSGAAELLAVVVSVRLRCANETMGQQLCGPVRCNWFVKERLSAQPLATS